jgi:hypothetical protein
LVVLRGPWGSTLTRYRAEGVKFVRSDNDINPDDI